MPELPEVETVVRTLRPHLIGREISDLDVRWHRTVSPHTPDSLREILIGDRIDCVQRRAKLIVVQLTSQRRLTVHLRMTGELRIRDAESHLRNNWPYLRAALELDSWAWVDFYDVRKFGRIRLFDEAEWEASDRELGVEPLSAEFTANSLATILTSRQRQMKPLLLDQTAVAGLGNIYVDEALFKSRIHPLQRSDLVSRQKINQLHVAIQETLQTAIESRGTTIRNYRTGTGEPGENQERLLVYGKKPGTPCPRCGKPLRRLVVGQRGTVFCSNCQRLRR